MTMPTPDGGFTIEPAAVEALAAELGALARELSEDAGDARSAAAGLPTALAGQEGEFAGAAARTWASLEEILALRTAALADTLRAAIAAYRGEDVFLAERVGTLGPGGPRRPR
jgi:hypothetical protein